LLINASGIPSQNPPKLGEKLSEVNERKFAFAAFANFVFIGSWFGCSGGPTQETPQVFPRLTDFE